MKKLALTFLFAFGVLGAHSQNFTYHLGFDFFADNLEGCGAVIPTRTLIDVKLTPEIGVTFDDKHSVMIGASLIQDLGGEDLFGQSELTLYYKYNSEQFKGYAGAIPRRESFNNFPLSIFREEYIFMQSNIKGILLQYENKRRSGYAEFFLDWYGQNQDERIDEFILAANSEYDIYNKYVYVGGSLMINHLKNEYKLYDSYLFERAYYNLYLGGDFVSLFPKLNKARVSVGTNSSMEHKRILDEETSWSSNLGWQIDLDVNWKGLGLKNQFYFGASQLQYYDQYGDDIYWGSQFYQYGRYNMTEVYYDRSWKFLNFKGQFKLHATPEIFANQALLTISVNIDQMLKNGKFITL